jgi:hypothetical protein
LYLGLRIDNYHAWTAAERAWGRSFAPGGIVRALAGLSQLGTYHWLLRDLAFSILYVALLAVAARRGVGRSWIGAGLLIVLLPLTSGSLASDARFGLLAIPVYWGLAFVAHDRAIVRPLAAASLVLLAASTLTIPLSYP